MFCELLADTFQTSYATKLIDSDDLRCIAHEYIARSRLSSHCRIGLCVRE